jgi:dephospho-CoA kinase
MLELTDHIQRKPIIGLAGGIGSGKSFVGQVFGALGCLVISSDEQAKQAYNDPVVQERIRQWWGESVFTQANLVDRSAIARRIFENPGERDRLERLLHPWINAAREHLMKVQENDPQVLAFVWDTPLLFETGLNRQCDAVVFVDAPLELRLKRVTGSRRWAAEELGRREKLQWPLDKKKKISHYVIVNTADADAGSTGVRDQVREILSQILTTKVSPIR